MVTELFGSAQTASDPLLDRLRTATRGAYEIAGELGRGGMAIVYVGRDLKLRRAVAIKVMDPRLSLSPGMAERFLQEAQIAAHLQHPNIIVVHDIRQSDDLIFFVMSLVQGGALDDLLRHAGVLPVAQIRWILLQATNALAFAHSEGIIHRDVKPANILLNLKGDVILTDFGIAKAIGNNGMTKSGTQIGTPAYMSPEQLGDGHVGASSDQYALGVTAYQLITGTLPFSGELYQLIAAHSTLKPRHIRELRPDCPAFLANAVMRMLEKRSEDRWQSLSDLQGVFAAGMEVDGGAAKRQLASAAQQMQAERAATIVAFTAKLPLSPAPGSWPPPEHRPQHEMRPVIFTISPPGATVFAGGTLDLRLNAELESGETLPASSAHWTSSDSQILSVSDGGRVSGHAAGTAVIRATVHGAWREATIRVESAPIARITVANPKLTLRAGDIVRPSVAAVDVNGVLRPDVSLAWISRSPSVIQLDAPGTLRAIKSGDAVIDVSVGNVRREIEVTVVNRTVASVRIRPVPRTMELGDACALFVDAIDDLGSAVVPPNLRWSSDNAGAIHVDSVGTVLAIGAGIAQVSVQVDDASDVIELEAIEEPIGTIEIVLATNAVEVGDEVSVLLRVRDIHGVSRSPSGVRVWSDAPGIAEVNSRDLIVRAVAAGTARIFAAGQAADAVIGQTETVLRVVPVGVHRIDVQPPVIELEQGAVAAFVIRCLDRRGRVIPDVVVNVSSTLESVATITRSGAVLGVATGLAELRMWVAGVSGGEVETRVSVCVRRPGVSRLALQLAHTSLIVGETADVVVAAYNALGESIADFVPMWRSSDAQVATVSNHGRVRAIAAGRATITVEIEGKSEGLEIVVCSAPLRTLTIVTPRTAALVGVPLPLAIEATDMHGARVVPTVVWTVSPDDFGHVSSSGEVTPARAGNFTVRAVVHSEATGASSVAGVTEAKTFILARAPRAEWLKFDCEAVSLAVGERQRIIATALLEGRTQPQTVNAIWSTDNPALLRVDADGLLQGLSAGTCRVSAEVGGASGSIEVTIVPGAGLRGLPRRVVVVAAGSLVMLAVAWFTWGRADTIATQHKLVLASDSIQKAIAASRTADRTREVDSVRRIDSTRTAETTRQRALTRGAAAPPPRSTSTQASVKNTIDTGSANVVRPAGAPTVTARGNPNNQTVRSTGAVQSLQSARTLADSGNSNSRGESDASAVTTSVGQRFTRDEMRAMAVRIVEGIGTGSRGNNETRALLAGRLPKVELVPSSSVFISETAGRVRMQFEVNLSAYDLDGVHQKRIAKVTFEASGRRPADLNNVQIGPLVKQP